MRSTSEVLSHEWDEDLMNSTTTTHQDRKVTNGSTERRLEHENGEAGSLCATLSNPARVGIEATLNAQWFERVLGRYHHELWIRDAAEIRASRVRKQKTSI